MRYLAFPFLGLALMFAGCTPTVAPVVPPSPAETVREDPLMVPFRDPAFWKTHTPEQLAMLHFRVREPKVDVEFDRAEMGFPIEQMSLFYIVRDRAQLRFWKVTVNNGTTVEYLVNQDSNRGPDDHRIAWVAPVP